MTYEELKEKVEKNGQGQILANYSKLDENQKKELAEQISRIDFEKINKLYEQTKKPVSFENDVIETISYIEKAKLNDEEYTKNIKNEVKNASLM